MSVLSGLLLIPDAVLVGTNQGYRSLVVTTLVYIASNVAMVGAALAGFGAVSLASILVTGAVANALVTWRVVRRRVSWWGIARPTRADISRVGSFSAWTMGWRLVNRGLQVFDGILIGALAGAVVLAKYSFSTYILQFALSIAMATTSALMPRLGNLLGRGQMAGARNIVDAVKQANLAIVISFGALMLAANRLFVSRWVGSDLYMGDLFNLLSVVMFIQVAFIRNDTQIQDAALSIRTRVFVGAGSTVVGVGIALALYRVWASPSAVVVGLIIGRLPMSAVFAVVVRKLIPVGVGLSRSVLSLAVLAVAAIAGFTIPDLPLGWSVMYLCVVLAVVGTIAWYGLLASQLRKMVVQTLRNRSHASRDSH